MVMFMNKKQMRKEQERLKKERNQIYMDFNNKDDVKKVVFIALGVVLFIGLVFVLINIFNGTWKVFTRENEPVSDQGENRVICGTMFGKSDDEYLVLAYDFNDESQVIYESLKESYSGNKPFYILDLHSAFNNACVGDKTNISSDLSKLKLSVPTLLRIKGNEIVGSYTTKDSIKDYLLNLK